MSKHSERTFSPGPSGSQTSPSAAAIVHPSPSGEQVMGWHPPKSKSEVSCGFAGSQVFCFSGRKQRKALKTLGFSGVPRSGTLFAKKLLVFRGSVRLLPFISSLGKKSSHYTWTKGCRFGGCFGKKLCKFAKFIQQSHAIRSCEDSIHHTVRLQPKRVSHSLTAT